jgi:hypothetical protein
MTTITDMVKLEQHGDHWQPAALLEQLAAEGRDFTES